MTPAWSYDPFVAPLDVPVTVFEVRCFPEAPLAFPQDQGKTVDKLLNGFFGLVLGCTECARPLVDDEPAELADFFSLVLADPGRPLNGCQGADGRLACNHTPACACAGLANVALAREPGREVGPLARLAAPELWQAEPAPAFTLRVSVVGRRAQRHHAAVRRVLGLMGQVGLHVRGERVRFGLAGERTVAEGSLHEVSARLGATDGQALLEIVTPLLLRERVQTGPDRVERLFQSGGELDLARVLGNLAFDLADLDLDEREAVPVLERKALAEQARSRVEEEARSLRVARCQLTPFDLGSAPSKRGRDHYEMRGFTGTVVLEGVSPGLWPWLVALGAWRGGQLGSKGFGQVRVWSRGL